MITKEKFRKYLVVQLEGKYNMLQKGIEDIIGITKEEVKDIQKNYRFYNEQFKSLRQEVEQELLKNL